MRDYFNYYRVTTHSGGSIPVIAVDKRHDTLEERGHRAWCTLLENERSPEYKMAMRLISQLGVEKTKEFFVAALIFEKELDLVN